jgi:hypothetical protein
MKTSTNYTSLFQRLVDENFPFFRRINIYLYETDQSKRKHRDRNPTIPKQILGGLQPLADILKDVVDTFKPYKSSYHVKRDLLQPIRALGNIVKGIILITAAPLFFIGDMVRYMFISGSLRNFGINMIINSSRTASWLLEGVFSILRGAGQLATTPLTWALRMPLRGIISAIKGMPKIEDNPSLQSCLQKGETIPSEHSGACAALPTADVINELHRKFNKSLSRGQRTDISSFKEETAYRQAMDHFRIVNCQGVDRDRSSFLSQENISKYFSLFKNKKQSENIPGSDINYGSIPQTH